MDRNPPPPPAAPDPHWRHFRARPKAWGILLTRNIWTVRCGTHTWEARRRGFWYNAQPQVKKR